MNTVPLPKKDICSLVCPTGIFFTLFPLHGPYQVG